MALASALAVGALTGAPLTAAAAPVLTVPTPLPQGQVIPSTAAAFGSTLVWDSLRSSDGGTTWVADSALSGSAAWTFIGGGKMARTVSAGTTATAYVYTPATGDVQSYTIDGGPESVNATYASYVNAVRDLATNTATPLTQPSGAAATFWTHELGPSDALVWNGATDGVADLYAASTSPTATPSPWVEIPGVVDRQVTDSDLLTLEATASATTLCRRGLADLTAAPTCVTVLSGDHTADTWTVTSLGTLSFVHVQDSTGTVDDAYVVDAALTTVTPVALATGSTALEALPGGSPDIVVLDANGVPSVQTVAANGALTLSFTIPASRTISPEYLAVTPDRVVGGDQRDGSRSVQVWSRTVSGSGFGAETFLPVRASGLVASAGRTAVMGRAGVSVYDRGTLQHTFADQASVNYIDLSGPYVAEMLVDDNDSPYTKVSKTDGTPVAQYTGWAGGLFGSTYLDILYDASSSGSVHVVVHDLTGVAANKTYTLPQGTADCYAGGTWGSELLLWCADGSHVYDYVTNTIVGSTDAWVEALGDGYAVVNDGSAYSVWNLATGVTTPLGCSSIGTVFATDGVGHVTCPTSTDLAWSDFSALATHAPRLLGALASPTASFSEAHSTWSLALDTTKALNAGSVAIRNGTGTLVRSLPTAASADGSVRVTWDGLNDAGKPVPPGTYSYTLTASATDGTGQVATISGGAMTSSGTVKVTSASTLDMAAGGFAALPPSRLLDTRITPPKLGSQSTRTLKVTGVGGVPSTGVSAVVLNVTVTDTTATGYLTVSPYGTTRPVVSNLNWASGDTIPNAVTVKVGTDGQIDLYQSGPGSANVIVDVAGYYLAGDVTDAGGFTSLSPSRILDTRTTGGGGKLASGESRDLQILGMGSVPDTGVSAVVLNMTVTDTNAVGYLTVFPSGTSKPLASNLNWSSGMTVPNLVTVKVGDNGKVTMFQSGSGSANVIADVAGYYLGGGTPDAPGMFVSVEPSRVLDTRTLHTPVPALSATSIHILGIGGIPATRVSAVVVNATVTDTATAGYLTVYPGDSAAPTASNLNWSTANATTANLATAQVGADGTIGFFNGSPGRIAVIADTAGYFLSY